MLNHDQSMPTRLSYFNTPLFQNFSNTPASVHSRNRR